MRNAESGDYGYGRLARNSVKQVQSYVGGLSNTECSECGYRLRVRVQITEWPFGVRVWKCPPDHARDTTDWGANVRGVCVERDGCTRADADAATAAAAQHFIRMLRVSLALGPPTASINIHRTSSTYLAQQRSATGSI